METTRATCKTIQRKLYNICNSRFSYKFTTLSLLIITCILNSCFFYYQYHFYDPGNIDTRYCIHCNDKDASIFQNEHTCGKSSTMYRKDNYDNLGNQDFSRRMCMPPIDVVYTWVNGSDDEWKSSMEYWRGIYVKLKAVKTNIYDKNDDNDNNNISSSSSNSGMPSVHSNNDSTIITTTINSNNNNDNNTSTINNNNNDNFDDNIAMQQQSIQAIACNDTSSLQCNITKSMHLLHAFFSKYDDVNTTNMTDMMRNETKTIENNFTNITNAVQDLLPPEITIGTSNRYRDNHELKYSFRSLFKYAPWIRQVFLVTSGHIPNWLNTKHPKMTVVTHSDLWKNKTYLPTFSSPAIETQLHRINGLSKKFIYFNDDVLLGAPVWPEDFFSLSGVQKIFLSWDVPKCNPGCTDSWVGDGQCDLNCNVSRCLFDLGDCLNVSKKNAYGYRSNSGSGTNGKTSRTWAYCAPGCPSTWIGDKVCDKKCDNLECGYDGGDCGIDVIYDNLNGYDIFLDNKYNNNHIGQTSVYGESVCELKPNKTSLTVINLKLLTPKCKNVLVPPPTTTNRIRIDQQQYINNPIIVNCSLYTEKKKQEINIKKLDEVKRKRMVKTKFSNRNVTNLDSNKTYVQTNASIKLNDNGVSSTSDKNQEKSMDKNVELLAPIYAPVGARAIYLNLSSLIPNHCHTSLKMNMKHATHDNDVAIGGAVFLQYYKVFVILLRNEADPGLLKTIIEFQLQLTLDDKIIENHNLTNADNGGGFMKFMKIAIPLFTDIGVKEADQNADKTTMTSTNIARISSNTTSSMANNNNNKININNMNHTAKLINITMNDINFENMTIVTTKSTHHYKNGRRKLLGGDTYGDSLVKVNMLYNKEFGASSRKVPAHMPHLIDRDVINELHSHPKFKHEFELTSQRKFRSSHDMQYSFSYFHWVIHQKKKVELAKIFNSEIDTDGDGILNSNELRTLASMMLGESPDDSHIKELLKNNCTTLKNIHNCQKAIEGIRKNIHQPSTHEKAPLDEVTFQMIGDDYNATRKMLDGIRAKRTKFICVNDDMKNPSNAVIQVLQDFFHALYPIPSPFELPSGIVNELLEIDLIREEVEKAKINRQRMHLLLVGLFVFVAGVYCKMWFFVKNNSD